MKAKSESLTKKLWDVLTLRTEPLLDMDVAENSRQLRKAFKDSEAQLKELDKLYEKLQSELQKIC
jgi:hypothetical protein